MNDTIQLSDTTITALATQIAESQKEWLSPTELATQFGFPASTQANLRMLGRIPYHKRGRYIRYKRSEIDAWLTQGKVV